MITNIKFTKSYKSEETEKKWWIIDAEGKVLGRIATQIAILLRGKHKSIFTPHEDCGDFVIIINASKVKLTGSKEQDKYYYRHSSWKGGLRKVTAGELKKNDPERMFLLAVKNMLPKNRLSNRLLKKLKVYSGPEHSHEAQKPEKYNI